MALELDVYSGKLTYKNIEFDFVFDGKELRMIPPESKQEEVRMWSWDELANGITRYTPHIEYIEEDYLKGTINENNTTIFFFSKKCVIGHYQFYILSIIVNAYAIFDSNKVHFDRISFKSKEVDCIFSINDAIKSSEWSDNGVISITTKSFNDTTSSKQTFSVDDKTVSVYFGMTYKSDSNLITNSPLVINSSLFFEFDSTQDVMFILKLWKIAKQFLQYLFYRKNICIPAISIFAPDGDKHIKTAVLYINDDTCEDNYEFDPIKKERHIKQKYIEGFEGKILNDIVENKLYCRHIPESFSSSKHYNAARFVMITAAFEWEFKKQHPDGIIKKDKTIEAENKATKIINELIDKSQGELKTIFKRLRNSIGFINLESEIIQIGKEYSSIIGIFGDYLYKLNSEILKYNEMGHRIAEQRNNFAHGNLDKDIIGLSLLDLMFLERIVYAMQLKYWGISNINIQNIINDIFGAGVALPTA